MRRHCRRCFEPATNLSQNGFCGNCFDLQDDITPKHTFRNIIRATLIIGLLAGAGYGGQALENLGFDMLGLAVKGLGAVLAALWVGILLVNKYSEGI